MWIGSDDYDWRPLPQRLPQRSGNLLPRTHLWCQEGIAMNPLGYKEVTVLAQFHIRIPEPFPRQEVSFHPEPIRPYIVLERLEFDLVKVVAVQDVGGLLDGRCIIWGSILVRESRFLAEGQKAVQGSFNANDPLVMALDRAGHLLPQSGAAYTQ